MPLIDDIRTHILDPKFPLTSILREALVLARKLRSEELTKWVNSELEGYKSSKEELPNYRKYKASSIGSGVIGACLMKNVPIPTFILPAEMRRFLDEGTITGGVRELESLLESKKAKSFHKPWPNEIINHYNYLHEVNISLISAYIVTPRGVIEHVLDTVRTRLLQFIIEIEELNPDAGEIPSLEKVPPAVTHKIFKSVIMNKSYHGNAQKIEGVFGSNVATGQARISSSHATYSTTAEATSAFQSLKNHLDEVAEEQRQAVQDAIDLLISAIENNGIPKSRVVAAAETIANASDKMKRVLRDLSIGTAGSLAASGLWEGIRYAIGAG